MCLFTLYWRVRCLAFAVAGMGEHCPLASPMEQKVREKPWFQSIRYFKGEICQSDLLFKQSKWFLQSAQQGKVTKSESVKYAAR